MGSYYGRVAIFENPVHPELIFNSRAVWVYCIGQNTFIYIRSANCFILRMAAYVEGSKKPDLPFLLIRPSKRLFSFIEWNDSSVYYSFDEIDKERIRVSELNPKQLARYATLRTGEIISLTELQWFSLDYLDDALSVYHDE